MFTDFTNLIFSHFHENDMMKKIEKMTKYLIGRHLRQVQRCPRHLIEEEVKENERNHKHMRY